MGVDVWRLCALLSIGTLLVFTPLSTGYPLLKTSSGTVFLKVEIVSPAGYSQITRVIRRKNLKSATLRDCHSLTYIE